MNTTPKDNTPDELDIFIRDYRDDQHICQDEGYGCEYEQFTAYGRENTRCKLLRESDDSLKQKLRDYIVREIDVVIGENSYINKASGAVTDEQFYQNGLRASQREVSADRGWRIG